MKAFVWVVLLLVSSVSGISRFGCMSLNSFNQNNIEFFSKDIRELVTKKNIPLLNAVLGKRKQIGKGSFGVVASILDQKSPLALKIMNPVDHVSVEAVKEEVKMLKEVCEESFDENSTQLIGCEGKEIAAFKGCVEHRNPNTFQDFVYIFQRQGYCTLEKSEINGRYRAQPAIKRAVMMLRILEKVASFHKKDIVHSDIKPANIVLVKSDMREFELIDLGMARRAGSSFFGGSAHFISPEYWNAKDALTPELDVYSIGVTLLHLESPFFRTINAVFRDCFKSDLTFTTHIKFTQECHKKITDAVPKAIVDNQTREIFADVFQKALAYAEADRYSSALEFLVDIIDKLYLVPGYKGYIYDLLKRYKEKKEKEDKINQKLGKAPSSTLRWEEVAIYLGYDAAPPGLVERAKRFFICETKKKETPKAPAWKKDLPEYLVSILKKKYKEEFSARWGKEPEIVRPEIIQPNIIQPNIIQPDIIQPNIIQPDIIQPNIIQPEIIQPEIIQPNIIQPENIRLTMPQVNEDQNSCIACYNDDDEEIGQEGELQQAQNEYEEIQKMNNHLNAAIWDNLFSLENTQQQQQLI